MTCVACHPPEEVVPVPEVEEADREEGVRVARDPAAHCARELHQHGRRGDQQQDVERHTDPKVPVREPQQTEQDRLREGYSMLVVLGPQPLQDVRLVARQRRHQGPVFGLGDVAAVLGQACQTHERHQQPYAPDERLGPAIRGSGRGGLDPGRFHVHAGIPRAERCVRRVIGLSQSRSSTRQ